MPSSYPRFDSLPPGVLPLKDYPSLGATLVECSHAETIQILGGNYRPVEGRFCRVCRTCDPDRPVKMLAVVPTGAQPSLF